MTSTEKHLHNMINIIEMLDAEYVISESLTSNGYRHGFRPASKCPNEECSDVHILRNLDYVKEVKDTYEK